MRRSCAGRFLPAAEEPCDVLQTQQTESEQTGAAVLARGKACKLGGCVGLPTREGADKQTGEVAMLLFVRGILGDGEQRDEQLAEDESASVMNPSPTACCRSKAVADCDGEFPPQHEPADGIEAIDEVAERTWLVAAPATQLSQRAACAWPVAVDRIGRNMEERALMLGCAALHHSSAELDHGLACECSMRHGAWETAPVLQLSGFELLHGCTPNVLCDHEARAVTDDQVAFALVEWELRQIEWKLFFFFF